MNLYNERYFVAPYNMPPNPKGIGLTFISDRNPTSRKKDMSNQVVPGIAHALAKVTRGTHAQYIPMDEEFFFRGYSLTERKIGRAQFEGRLKYPFTSKEEMLHKSLPRITLVGNNYYYPPTRVYIQRRLDTITNSLETHFFDLMGIYLDDMDPTRRSAEVGKLYNKGYMGRPGLLNFLSQYLQDHFCTNEDPVRRPRITQSTRIRQQVQPNPIPASAFLPGTWYATVPTPAGFGGVGGGPGRGPGRGPGGPGGPGGPDGYPEDPEDPEDPGSGHRNVTRRRKRPRGEGGPRGGSDAFLEAWGEYTVNGGGEEAFMATQDAYEANITHTNPTGETPTINRNDTLKEIMNDADISPTTQERIRIRKENDQNRKIQSTRDPNALATPAHRPTGLNNFDSEDSINYIARNTLGDSPFNIDREYRGEEEDISNSVEESKTSFPPQPPLQSMRTEQEKQQQKDASKGLSERISTQANRYLNSLRENNLNYPYAELLSSLMLEVDKPGITNTSFASDINDTLQKQIKDYEDIRLDMMTTEAGKIEAPGLDPQYPLTRLYSSLNKDQLARLQKQNLRLCFHHLQRMEEEEATKKTMAPLDLQDERGRSLSFLDLNQSLIEYAQTQKQIYEQTVQTRVDAAIKAEEKRQRKYFTTNYKEQTHALNLEKNINSVTKPLRFYMGVLPTVLTNAPEFEDVIDFGTITYLYQQEFRPEFNEVVSMNSPHEEKNFPAIYATLFAMQMKYLFYRRTEEFEDLLRQQAPGNRSPSVGMFYYWLKRDPTFVTMGGADQEIVDAFFSLPGMNQKSCADAFEDAKTCIFSCSLMAATAKDYEEISAQIRNYLNKKKEGIKKDSDFVD